MTSDLLVFGEDWGALPSSTQHLISHIAQMRNTIWVNSIGLRRPRISVHDMKRIWDKVTATQQVAASEVVLPSQNFHILNPITIPAPKYQLERSLASKLLLAQLLPLLQQHDLNSPILWTSLPTAVDMVDGIDHRALVYYCGDDFSGLAGVDHETILEHEQKLVKKADLIIAASEVLATRFPANKTRVLTHGVNYPLFATPTSRALDLIDNGRPIAGFYGSISEWLDLDLLQQVIQRLPQWNFVFIGKVVVDVSQLQRLDNVTFLGERDHQQLPSYSQHWTASLLPFVDNSQIQNCNPLKLREYLAAGRAVISTPFPALAPYKQHISIVNNVDEMVHGLIESESKPANPQQQCAVIDQTWSAQADKLISWLEAL